MENIVLIILTILGIVKSEVSPPSFVSPTPFLFQEMTIPHLQNREYKSELGELQKISDNINYTSYLTNYNSDGLKINGLITKPKDEIPEGGFPAIVFVHGYISPSIYKTTEKYIAHVNYLARNGFVVFKIDLRGHNDSEGEASGAYYSSDYIIDTLNAYSALQNADFVNPKRIGLWGHSMAGNIVSRSWAAKPEIPAVVIWAGAGYTYSDLLKYRIMDNSYRAPQQTEERAKKRKLLTDTYGAFDPNNWFWKMIPATNYLNDIRGEIEIHHATDDNVVSIDYSRNLMKILDGTSIPHSLYEYSSGGHNIDGASFNSAIQRTIEFFRRTL